MLAMNNATCSRIAERPYDTPKHEEVAICVANQRIPNVYRIARASKCGNHILGSEAIRSIITQLLHKLILTYNLMISGTYSNKYDKSD